jgi:hypothetical protein
VATQNPDWSYVFIDGKKSFMAPTVRWPVDPGRHRITLSNETFRVKPHETTVVIAPGGEVRICFDFETRKEGCR